MPFSTTKWPVVGISILKGRLLEEGIPCDIKYFNFDFAEMIGIDLYEEISLVPPQLIGERLFAQDFFGSQLADQEHYKAHLRKVYTGPESYVDKIFGINKFIKPFLDRCMQTLPWESYKIIGFTSMFEQNLSSISLASRIKKQYPDKTIVFGGANCSDEMGEELHRSFPFIDIICNGEADFSFPELVKRILSQESYEELPGVIYRSNGESIINPATPMVDNMDALPCPNYDDYFSQMEKFPFLQCEELHMETSRGCWWGAKHHCTFCGLNAETMGFRAKSKDNVIDQIKQLTEKYASKYNIGRISMVDNILDMSYFKELIPELKKKKFNTEFFYEVKANLSEHQIKMMSEAGITSVQPGIESLSTNILGLMKKGITSLQNIQFLKYCKQFNVYPTWNIIFGFPGEKQVDYHQTVEMIYKITHLVPTEAVIPLSMQRFSPYFMNPDLYGITNLRPEKVYGLIYPFKEERISKLAYFFEYECVDDFKPVNNKDELMEAVDFWRDCYNNGEGLYSMEMDPANILIEDSRTNSKISQMILDDEQKAVYEYCNTVRSFPAILKFVRKEFPNDPVRARDVKDFLNEMVELDLMVSEEDKYLSLAISNQEESRAA